MLNQILSFAKCGIDFSLFCWLYSFFFKPKYNLKWRIAVVVIFSASLMLVNSLYIAWLNTAAGLLIGILLALILFEGPVFQIALCAVLAVSALLTCEFIPIAISSIFINDNIVDIMNRTIYDATFNLIGSTIFFFVISVVRLITQKKRIGLSTNSFVIFLPVLSVVVIYFMLYSSAYVPSNSRNAAIYLFLYIAIISANAAVILGERNVEKKLSLEQEIRDLRYKEDLADALIKQQGYYIEELNGLRHDFKRQLMGLQAISFIGKPEGKYIDEVLDSVSSIQTFAYIESLPLRVIVDSTYNRCVDAGIEFTTNIRYSNFDFMSYPDIYSFFDNALENAVEACNSITDNQIKKYITLSITRKNEMLFVQISNSSGTSPEPSKYGFISTKQDPAHHGYGTKNIHKIASKYHAQLSYETGKDYKMTCFFPCINVTKEK